MSFASGLYGARKKSGLSQEAVAEKLGVSRQTISKWETGETLPDIRQSKGLAMLYHVTLDELVEYDFDELLAFHINVRYHIGRAAFFGDAADLAVQDQSPGAFGDGRGLPRPGLLHFICDHHGPSLPRCSFFYYTSNRRERQKARENGKGRPRAQKFIRRPAAPVPGR